jgi:predicted phosphodiesterase
MRLAAISDVHGNLPALEAVLNDIKGKNIREKVFIGDSVGYGPDPNEVTLLIKSACKAHVAGNHDWAVLGLTDIAYFNPAARAAIRWTDGALTEKARIILDGWPIVKALKREEMLLVHSTPIAPEEWNYLFSPEEALPHFDYFKQKICLVGHSHIPFIAELLPSGRTMGYREGAALREDCRYIINVGSVGQPRDRDPRAAYALFDAGTVEIVRVAYDIRKTQERMTLAGLPEPLIERLAYGV